MLKIVIGANPPRHPERSEGSAEYSSKLITEIPRRKLLGMTWWAALAIVLSACSKAPDLDAPCREFGRYCPQQPINVGPLENYQGEK